MAFTIQDDDASYFTDPRLLEWIYRRPWNMGFRTSIAAIPMHKAIDDPNVAANYRGTGRLFDLRDNKPLIEYLRKNCEIGAVDIIQHGYTHEEVSGKPEFFIDDERDIRRRLNEGKRLLDATFGQPVTVFSPPHGMISRKAWRVLAEEGMAVCRTFGPYTLFRNTPLNWNTLSTIARICFSHPHPLKTPVPQGMIDYGDALEIQVSWLHAVDIPPDTQRFQEVFRAVMNHHGIFNLLTHHWQYDGPEKETMRDTLYDMLASAESHNIWKTSLSEAARWIRTRRMIKAHITRKNLFMASPSTFPGATVFVRGCSVLEQKGVSLTRTGNETMIVADRIEGNTPLVLQLGNP